MRVTLLKSKLHRATVTDSSLHYEGSISIPPYLIELAGLFEYEKVLVANVNNGRRFETYVIRGEEGRIQLNGAAAHLGKPGDKVIIMAWTSVDSSECAAFKPKIVILGDANQPKD
ncbi:MAG: aspartate 1-decarboxylase [Planctomycetota bacterium]|jgi:aspartate 1-decarboxylase|nr:aspartate 1-decarboxylase [Planctomycetota bacterium]